MSFHFTLFYPENLAPASVNEVLRQLLIPRKWRHFLRIEQNILVNGHYRYFNQNILPGDKIEINLDHVESDQQAYAPSGKMPDVIYEDDNLLIINKKKGQKTHPNLNETNTALNDCTTYLGQSPYIVHRLDKDTSGLVVFAKNIKTKNYLQDNWDKVERRYKALVLGKTKEKDILKNYLKENKNHYVYIADTGDLAITIYKKIKEINNNSLLDINIKTGKKNQIRVQLSNINHPILGDKKYGSNNYKRLCCKKEKIS